MGDRFYLQQQRRHNMAKSNAVKKQEETPTSPIILSNDELAKLNTFPSKSAKIKWLASIGKTTSHIATILGIRYQHAYNVLHAPVVQKEQPVVAIPEPTKGKTVSKQGSKHK